MVPWMGVFLLLLLKPNRTRAACAIALPFLVVWGALWLIRVAVPFVLPLPPGIGFLWLGLAALWLLAYRLESLSRKGAFFAALLIMLGVGAAGFPFSICFEFTPRALSYLAMGGATYAAASAVVLAGMAGGALACRRRYSARNFNKGAILSLALLIPILTLGFYLFALHSTLGFSWTPGVIVTFGVMGAIWGLLATCGLFAALLPFLLLAFYNRVYRERFFAVFRFVQTPSPGPDESGHEGDGALKTPPQKSET